MQRGADERIWSKLPGQTSNGEGEESDEEEHDEERERRGRARKGLEEIAAVLGDRWLDVPCVDFSPVGPQVSADSIPPRQPPSQWGVQGPPLSFRVEHVRAPVVRDTMVANGLTQTSGKDWVVMWSGPRMRDKEYEGLHELQRVNHFPGSTELTRKDRICVHFDRMARRFGSGSSQGSFNFLPETFVLPRQVDEFLDVYRRNPSSLWIVKPNASSQGRGIFILRDLEELPQSENDITVVSRYIDKPLLIQGLKFDLRIYVLVTSFEPLRAYVYREGLTRFASSPYSTDKKDLKDAYRHLTNYSINKKSENFVENKQAGQDNVGHKWSFSAFNKHLEHVGVDTEIVWSGILDLCLKTLISVRPVIAAETKKATVHCANCFELYGFDVLVDEDLKPWLIEVNLSPSMLAESPLDQQVKSAVLSDTFNLVGVANASWRTLATAKLRSQLLQMRHSMAMASQAAAAFKAGQQPAGTELGEHDERAAHLAEMPERDLKMMAQALKEVSRCNNFIRLYPTAKTVERYAPLMRAPSPTCRLLLQMLLGSDVCIPEAETSTAQVSHPDALPVKKVELQAEPKAARPDILAAIANSQPVQKASFEVEVCKPREVEYLDWAVINSTVEHNPARTTIAMQVLKPLAVKVSSRVVLVEYLLRVVNVCRALRMEGRTKLARCKAYKRLASFRQQLSIFLRTTAKASGYIVPSIEDMDNDFIEQLEATCRSSITFLSREIYAAASAVREVVPTSPGGSRNQLALPAQLPGAFAKSSRGEQIVETVQGLSSEDLEFILQGPACPPEFASLLGACARESADDFEELQMMIECCGTKSGPLSDLLSAFSPDESAMDSPGHTSPDREPPRKSTTGALPSIFSGAPLLANAYAEHQKSMAGSRSTSMLARLGSGIVSKGPVGYPAKPSAPAVARTLQTTMSLPSIHPNLSPQRQSYLPSSLPGLASLRSKQLHKPQVRAANDFMHTDIEF